MIRRLFRMTALVAITLVCGLAPAAQAQDPTTGSIASTAASGAVIVPMTNIQSVTVQLSGTWTGAAAIEFSGDGGVIFWPLRGVTNQTDGSPASGTTVNGVFVVPNAGYTHLKVKALALSAGTITVTAMRGFSAATSALSTLTPSVAAAPASSGLPLPLCNPVRTYNCQPKGF